jgi:tetratricopeptide (TPR) repeat protein
MAAATRRLALLAAGIAVIILITTPASAQDRWPPAAEKRFNQATASRQKGDYARAAALYQEVAEWPMGGPFPQRAQALYCAGLAFEQAHDFDTALASYHAVTTRFPKSEFAPRAREAAERLAPPGARGFEFRKRFDEAWDLLFPAMEMDFHGDSSGARPKLVQAEKLLAALLAEHREHPLACDVASALGDARMLLKDFTGAHAAFADAVLLATRETEKTPPKASAAGSLASARLKLDEATRAIRRRWLDRIAKAALGLVLVVFLATASPRSLNRSVLLLWGAFVAACGSLGGFAFWLAGYVKNSVDDHSPLEPGTAALIVFLPGLVGVTIAIGIARGRKPRALLGGAVGALAAAAVTVTIVYAYGLFPFLDSEL